MTANDVADLLSVHQETVQRYIRLGQPPATRLPSGHVRIRRQDGLKVLKDQED